MNDLETAPIANNDGNGRRKEGPGPGEGAHVDSMSSFCGPAAGGWVLSWGVVLVMLSTTRMRAGGCLRRNRERVPGVERWTMGQREEEMEV